MLIRSQDKLKIVNLQNVDKITVSEINNFERKIYSFAGDNVTTLGTYSTEEKAIKVLDIIQNAYYNFEYSKFLGCENDTFAGCNFQMPQDSEVNV